MYGMNPLFCSERCFLGGVPGGRGGMPSYRVYRVDPEGHITEPAWVLECEDDEQAILAAGRSLDGKSLEVWDGSRRIGTIPTEET
jgi:hypothetical protein